jgi:hypothetical protein
MSAQPGSGVAACVSRWPVRGGCAADAARAARARLGLGRAWLGLAEHWASAHGGTVLATASGTDRIGCATLSYLFISRMDMPRLSLWLSRHRASTLAECLAGLCEASHVVRVAVRRCSTWSATRDALPTLRLVQTRNSVCAVGAGLVMKRNHQPSSSYSQTNTQSSRH